MGVKVCPRCGRSTELVIETATNGDSIRREYYYRCVCGWRNIVSISHIVRMDGKIVVKHVKP